MVDSRLGAFIEETKSALGRALEELMKHPEEPPSSANVARLNSSLADAITKFDGSTPGVVE